MGLGRVLRRFDSVRTRLAMVALIVAAPFLVVQFQDIEAHRADFIEKSRQEANQLALASATSASHVFAEVRTLLNVLVRIPGVLRGSASSCAEFLRPIKNGTVWALDISVRDARGAVLCSTSIAHEAATAATAPDIGWVLKDRFFGMSGVRVDANGRPFILAANPVLEGDGAVARVVTATVDLSWLMRHAAGADPRQGDAILLVDRDGASIAIDAGGEAVLSGPHDAPKVVSELSGASGATVMATDAGGRERLYAAAPLGAIGGHILAGLTVEEMTRDLDERMREAYFSAAAIGLFIVFLAMFGGAVLFQKPLLDLLAVTRRLGAGDLSARIQLASGGAELRQIADSFNAMADRLEALATTDSLTGIANRRRFDHYLETEAARTSLRRSPMALALIDIDHFKLFNDRYGHNKGDEALKAVAKTLCRLTNRSGSLAGRLGGEEFAIGLADMSEDEALLHCERLRQRIADLRIPHADSSTGYLTVSVGLAALSPEQAKSPVEMVAMADAALYRSKVKGRNRVSIFRSSETAPRTLVA